jgi:hypothetical protein
MDDERYFAPVTGERPKRQLRPDASAKFAPVTVRVCPAVEASACEGVTDATIGAASKMNCTPLLV